MSATCGDWNKLYAAFDKLKNVEKEGDDDAKQQAEMLKQAIQSYVTGQQGGWTPLSPYTVEKKGSSTILIETGTMINSLTVDKVGDADYFIHFTGMNAEKSNEQVAVENEYGTSKAPPRPFVRPVYEREGKKAVEGVMTAIRELIS